MVGVFFEIEAVSASTSFDSLTRVSGLLPLSCLSLVIGADRTSKAFVGIVQGSLSLDIKLRLLVSAGNIVELSRVLVVPGNDVGVHGVGNLAFVSTDTAGIQLSSVTSHPADNPIELVNLISVWEDVGRSDALSLEIRHCIISTRYLICISIC